MWFIYGVYAKEQRIQSFWCPHMLAWRARRHRQTTLHTAIGWAHTIA